MALLGDWLPPIVSIGIVSLLSFVGFRLYARRVDDDPDSYDIRRGLVAGLCLVGTVAFVTVLSSGVDDAASAALDLVGIDRDSATVAVNLTTAAAGTLAATTAGYVGVLPAVLRARDLDVPVTVAVRRFVRWAGVFLGVLVLAIFLVGRVSIRSSGAVAVFVAGVVVVVYLAAPWLARLGTSTRSPTPGERSRLRRLCETVDAWPYRIDVMETGANRWPGALVRGPPGRRTLFVTDRLLDAYDDDAVEAVVAAHAARARRFYLEYRLGVAVTLVLAGYLALTESSTPLVAIGAIGVVAVGPLWVGNRLVYAADEAAAATADRDTVIDTYRAIAADAGVESSGRLGAFLRMRPPMDERIERLAADRTT